MLQSEDRAMYEAALTGLQIQKTTIEGHIARVQSLLQPPRRGRPPNSKNKTNNGVAASLAAPEPEPPARTTKLKKAKRKMSAAGRKAVGDATRKRWASYKKEQAKLAKKAASPKKKAVAKKKAVSKKALRVKGAAAGAGEAGTESTT